MKFFKNSKYFFPQGHEKARNSRNGSFEMQVTTVEFFLKLPIHTLMQIILFEIDLGPFKYYVIMFLTFLGPPTQLFEDLQYCKSSRIAIFCPNSPTSLMTYIILEWSLMKNILYCTKRGAQKYSRLR